MHKLIEDVVLQFVPDFSREELDVIKTKFYPKSLQKNEHLVHVGEIASEVVFIKKGLMRNYVPLAKGQVTNYFAEERTFNTSATSFFTQMPSYEAIQAIEPCEMFAITHDDLQELYRTYHNWERFGRLFIEALLVEQDLRIRWYVELSAKERYAAFVKTYPHLIQRVQQYHIASFLGITPESLSRLRSRS